MCNERKFLKDKKRIVVKIGSSSLMHSETGKLNLLKVERLVRTLVDIKNSGKDVILVSSGAIAVGRNSIGLHAGRASCQTGMCGNRTGQAHDGLPENIC